MNKLPFLPLNRKMEFSIDLVLGMTPISKNLYQMVLVKLKKLMDQLQVFLNKGFICPSVLPWGAPVLFLKEKDGHL